MLFVESLASSPLISVQTRLVSSSGVVALTTISGIEPRLVTSFLLIRLGHGAILVKDGESISS